jgi:hypothetical protein
VSGDDFVISVERLVNQVGHWEQSRWSAPAATPGSAETGRAEVMQALLQRLADLAADAEGNPYRPVPRPSDLILPDQLRVLADDLVTAQPPEETLILAAAEVNAARTAL